MSVRPLSEAERCVRAEARVGAVLCERWHLDGLLGVGGMAAVYAATHRNGNRVALKILHSDLACFPEVCQRFVGEGYAANLVGSPGVAAVLDEGVAEDGSVFMVMELLEGHTLEELCMGEASRPCLGEVLCIADKVLSVLERAHQRGVIHRDIKPENLFVCPSGQVTLLDFGIARVNEPIRRHGTEIGLPMGTPAFMPPEQARGRWEQVDQRTDLWALGATLFWAISGRFVREAASAQEELLLATSTPAPSLASVASDVPRKVVRFVDRTLAFDPAQRFADARAMRLALHEVLADLDDATLARCFLPPMAYDWDEVASQRVAPHRLRRRRRVLGLAALAAASIVSVGGWNWLTEPSASTDATVVPSLPVGPLIAPETTPHVIADEEEHGATVRVSSREQSQPDAGGELPGSDLAASPVATPLAERPAQSAGRGASRTAQPPRDPLSRRK